MRPISAAVPPTRFTNHTACLPVYLHAYVSFLRLVAIAASHPASSCGSTSTTLTSLSRPHMASKLCTFKCTFTYACPVHDHLQRCGSASLRRRYAKCRSRAASASLVMLLTSLSGARCRVNAPGHREVRKYSSEYAVVRFCPKASIN